MKVDISAWALRNRLLVHFLTAVLLLGGLWCCWQMSKLEDPEVKVKLAMVVVTYPGASAHEVELEVADPLERRIRTMQNVDNVESFSFPDMCILQVELLSTVPNDEVEQAWDMLRRRVSDARALLPSGASEPIVKDDFGNVFGLFYVLTGDGLTARQLTDYAQMMQRELSDVDGVDRVDLYGEPQECLDICIREDRMAALGVTPTQIMATLALQDRTSYSGYYQNGPHRIRVDVSDKFATPADIGSLLLQGHEGDQLRLGDVADIRRTEQQPVRAYLERDGERGIGLLVAATSGTDIVKVGAAVDERLAQLAQERLPAGVQCHAVFHQAQRVTGSLGTFALNLGESVVIVVLVLMVAMGLRSGLIIGFSLVVTVVGSFLFLYGMDGTMQRVSLASFVLAMGMLVDNAIVILDGILVARRAGRPWHEALTAPARQTAMPLLGATLIAILAFLPIFLSPDTVGVYVRDLFIVLAVSLLLSWVLAIVQVPLLVPTRDTAPERQSQQEGATHRLYTRALRFALAHRWSSVLVMLALVALSGWGFGYMRQGFFPDLDYDQLYMEYKMPEGTDPTRVLSDLQEMRDLLMANPHVTHVTLSTGGTPGRYNLVRSIANPSLSYGELIIDFTSPRTLLADLDSLQSALSDLYPDAYVKLKRYNLMFKKYPIEAQLLGPDPAVLHQLADSVLMAMRRAATVHLIRTDWEDRVPLLDVAYDQPSARPLALSRGDVGNSLLAATEGMPIGTFKEGTRSLPIKLRYVDADGRPVHDLTQARVFSTLPLPLSTPVGQVSRGVRVGWEDPVVPRYNGQRCQRVQCSPLPGLETEQARAAVQAEIERSVTFPEGYSLRWQGEREASQKAMKYLFRSFPLAVILIVAILIMLFGDVRRPVIILLTLPTILVGVVAVMLLFGKTFSFVAIVGTLGLMGMLTKNGIVLMDEIALQMSLPEADPMEALVRASRSRLRPVILASLTTVLGMIPLLSDAMFGSLAAAIMGGLTFGTLVTLLFLPVLYALFFNIRKK